MGGGRRRAGGRRGGGLLLTLLLALAAGLTGCASLPEAAPAPRSLALPPPAGAPLVRAARAALPADGPGLSGFRLVLAGESAFNLRLALAGQAAQSLDVQLYALADDDTGRGFLRALRDAAVRGVRVRLLVDDVHAPGDALLAGLAAYPGVQVRVFNPLPLRGAPLAWRLAGGVFDVARLNRRMHNKLLVADNAFALAGGRNVADAYFMHDPEANFLDLDLLVAGPVVPELSAVFDRYWNCGCAVPIERLVPAAPRHQAVRDRFDAAVRAGAGHLDERQDERQEERQGERFDRPDLVREIADGRLTLDAGPARVLADDPVRKLQGLEADELHRTVARQALALLGRARHEALVMSPYLIPGAEGLAALRALARAEPPVKVALLTNAIGATDELLADAAYERYRIDLLRAGLQIHELSPSLARDAGRQAQFGATVGRLHAKALVIDRRQVFIGSMNLDPRSTHTNTEMGLVIDSPVLAGQLATVFEQAAAASGHALRLTADDPPAIEWVSDDGQGHRRVRRDEPQAGFWQRLKLWLLRPWVSEELL